MTNSVIENTTRVTNEKCPLCGAVDFSKIADRTRDAADIAVMGCKNCKATFLHSFLHITPEFYRDNNMLPAGFSFENWLENSKADDKRRFKKFQAKIKDKVVLDVGCGAGGFLKLADKSAKEAWGTEHNEVALDFMKNCGLNVVKDFEDFEDGKFDLIMLFHVLEHIEKPVDFLKKIAPKLKHNGKLIIEVPHDDDALLSLYNCHAFKNFTYWKCHLYSFNITVLRKLIDMAGLKIGRIRYLQRYGLFNHLHWLLNKQPGGHKNRHFMNNKITDKIYGFVLKLLKKTDTVVLELKT